MGKHTPGPWKWYWKLNKLEADCGVYSEGREGHAYSVCRAPRYQGEKQWEADARLIAAAPDLLEACLFVKTWMEDCPPTELIKGIDIWAPILKAAISKAEGSDE